VNKKEFFLSLTPSRDFILKNVKKRNEQKQRVKSEQR
jgi:hypothetical protein